MGHLIRCCVSTAFGLQRLIIGDRHTKSGQAVGFLSAFFNIAWWVGLAATGPKLVHITSEANKHLCGKGEWIMYQLGLMLAFISQLYMERQRRQCDGESLKQKRGSLGFLQSSLKQASIQMSTNNKTKNNFDSCCNKGCFSCCKYKEDKT